MNKTFLVDAHTHIYDNYEIGYLLDSAHTNFSQQAQEMGHHGDYSGLLLLAESRGYNYFQALKGGSTDLSSSGWGQKSDALSKDNDSLIRFQNLQNDSLYIAAGRQIITREGIEVLSLFCTTEVQDGLKMDVTLEKLFDLECLIVLPWGVGKWLGQRGKVVWQLLQTVEPDKIAIGDISGRPIVWPLPKHFALASKRGINLISGTDPLPLKGQENRVGSYGCIIEIANADTAHHINKCLVNNISKANSIYSYGKQESILRFLKNQLMVRRKK